MMISCHSCAIVIQNGDTTHLNEDDMVTVMTTLKSLGMLTVTETGYNGHFYCNICRNTTVSDEYMVEEI